MLFKDFNVILPFKVREKIQYWVDKCDKEISGLGDAWVDFDQKIISITDAFLIEQECTAVETEMDDKAIAKAMYDAHVDETNGRKRNVRFWWHSHVNMAVSWSGTDTDTMGKLSEHGWFCNIVFNKKRDMRCAVSYPQTIEALGFKETIVKIEDNISVVVSSPFTADEMKNFDDSYKANYQEKVIAVPGNIDFNYDKSIYNPGDVLKSGRKFLWGTSWLSVTEDPNNDIFLEYRYTGEQFAFWENPERLTKYTLERMPSNIINILYREIEGMNQHEGLANFLIDLGDKKLDAETDPFSNWDNMSLDEQQDLMDRAMKGEYENGSILN